MIQDIAFTIDELDHLLEAAKEGILDQLEEGECMTIATLLVRLEEQLEEAAEDLVED